MSSKPRYRYNYKERRWDLLIRWENKVAYIPGTINPTTGMKHVWTYLL